MAFAPQKPTFTLHSSLFTLHSSLFTFHSSLKKLSTRRAFLFIQISYFPRTCASENIPMNAERLDKTRSVAHERCANERRSQNPLKTQVFNGERKRFTLHSSLKKAPFTSAFLLADYYQSPSLSVGVSSSEPITIISSHSSQKPPSNPVAPSLI